MCMHAVHVYNSGSVGREERVGLGGVERDRDIYRDIMGITATIIYHGMRSSVRNAHKICIKINVILPAVTRLEYKVYVN